MNICGSTPASASPLGLLPPRDVTLPPVPVAGLLPAGSLPATRVGFLDAAAAAPPAVVEAPAADPPLLGGPADLAPFLGAVAPAAWGLATLFEQEVNRRRNPPNPAKPKSNSREPAVAEHRRPAAVQAGGHR